MPKNPISATPSVATQNGYAIRALREKDGRSVQWLADCADLSAPHLRNIENEHRNASQRHLNLIARALNVPVAALCRDPSVDVEVAS